MSDLWRIVSKILSKNGIIVGHNSVIGCIKVVGNYDSGQWKFEIHNNDTKNSSMIMYGAFVIVDHYKEINILKIDLIGIKNNLKEYIHKKPQQSNYQQTIFSFEYQHDLPTNTITLHQLQNSPIHIL